MAPRKKSIPRVEIVPPSSGESIHFESWTYKGELEDNLPHGKGSYIHKDDQTDSVITYSGNWVYGKREGEWRESSLSIDAPGINYIWSWKDNQKHGVGKEVNLAPNLLYEWYYGEWKHGKKDGLWVYKRSYAEYSAWEFQNGELYNGYIMNNGKISRIIINGKKVWDMLAFIPWLEKTFTPFAHKKSLWTAKKQYTTARKKYQID